MPTPTVAERVIELLRVAREPLDDDEISRLLGVTPRQQINQVCRRLVQERRVRREDGPNGKIVNRLLS